MVKKRASAVAVKTVTSRPVLLLWASVSLAVAMLCTWSYIQPAWTLRTSSEIGSLDEPSPRRTAVHSKRVQRAISIPLAAEEVMLPDTASNYSAGLPSGRSAIPLVHIGLFQMCIYTQRTDGVGGTVKAWPETTVTCVNHAELDYGWLPPPWQVTRILCGGGCVVLLAAAVASLVVVSVRQQHRQQYIIKKTAIAQLTAGSLMVLGLCFYPLGLRAENLSHFCDQRCQPGWSSLVTAMASAAAFLCPVMASLIASPIYDLNPWEAYLLL